MNEDARFEDAQDAPLRLLAADPEDLGVIAALVQDAVLPVSEMTWRASERRFALLLNRFRWEDKAAVRPGGEGFERVQAVLAVDSVLSVASQGIDRSDTDTILSLLTIAFTPSEPPAGHVEMTFAGDGALRLAVECVDVTLRDVTRPYRAVSGHMPRHAD